MTPACMEYVQSALARFPAAGLVLEIGSLNVNGSVRELFADRGKFYWYAGIDRQNGPGVDYVGEIGDLVPKFASLLDVGWGDFGVVVSTEAFEHDATFWNTIQMAHRALRKDGLFIVTTRNIGFPRHDYPSDLYRFTADGLRAVLEWAGFTVLEAVDDLVGQGTFSVAKK